MANKLAFGTRLSILKRRLLAIGGDGFQYDWVLKDDISGKEMDALLKDGVQRDGAAARLLTMRSRACHENSAILSVNKGWAMWTGLALSEDGCWRIHSWAVNSRGRIVETTVRRKTYFGIPLTNEEVAKKYLWAAVPAARVLDAVGWPTPVAGGATV